MWFGEGVFGVGEVLFFVRLWKKFENFDVKWVWSVNCVFGVGDGIDMDGVWFLCFVGCVFFGFLVFFFSRFL